MSTPPPLTLILLVHEAGPPLAATLESVRAQRWIEPELIVVELGSSAGTPPAGPAAAPATQRVSLPGGSESEGLNRALAIATGTWVLALRAGERLVGDMVLSETLNWMKRTESGVVAGETAADDGGLQKLRSRVNAAAGNFAPRGGTFYRRSVFAENGDFDASLQWMAEYDCNVRLWKARVRFKPIPLRIVARPSGDPFPWGACREEMRVRHRYFPAARCLWWDLVSILRWLRRGGAARRR